MTNVERRSWEPFYRQLKDVESARKYHQNILEKIQIIAPKLFYDCWKFPCKILIFTIFKKMINAADMKVLPQLSRPFRDLQTTNQRNN